MKVLKVFLLSIFLHISNGVISRSNDLNQACIIRILQIRGKIEEDLPAQEAPSELCRILLPLIYANYSEKLCVMLWETKSIKAQCVIEDLLKNDYVDLQLKFEVYEKLEKPSKKDREKKLEGVRVAMRDILLNAAEKCKSDFSYGGIFEEILDINSNQKVFQKEYCLLKYVVENKFLIIRNLNINPHGIETRYLECKAILVQCQDDAEEKFMLALMDREYSSDAINCLMERYKEDRIFGWNTALEFLRKLEINEKVKRNEDFRISKMFSDYSKMSSNCIFSFNWSLFITKLD